jgi:hypothetical protein
MNNGEWVEGQPQWWWKYVFPQRSRFWLSLLSDLVDERAGPQPEPWVEELTSGVLEGLVMLQGVAHVQDEAQRISLRETALQKIRSAAGTRS